MRLQVRSRPETLAVATASSLVLCCIKYAAPRSCTYAFHFLSLGAQKLVLVVCISLTSEFTEWREPAVQVWGALRWRTAGSTAS